ncbi:pantoate--beta-alanine ligase isoform X2 [Amborella trichopoda]|uniref:pantoate--beta-alanine ligase isoform X2 n=1 Tax=Amborella trichopoda TaxID=13333 RepID=UPI0009BECE23|nr:pantoate--beta-alanine ligase isoform X2 [Amborella trichopoda]XP_020531095.1 pantoate--beta-alanine ligase isoform X2 [Amborella trichopoda]XP_020531096.1 pantoate--beta-alanine ligase isoform X2 [Amborella trichopoda]|eukprot:XP_020531094.1 pantoate--beta-alanine ligase isoform X2 [Amborella trichopoda]
MATEVEIITCKNQIRSWSRTMRSNGHKIALVPTMGYLHQGHISLVEEAKKHANLIVVSIYINPSQFAPNEDLTRYPSDFNSDLLKLKQVGVNVIFHPENLYETNSESGQTGSSENVERESGFEPKIEIESGGSSVTVERESELSSCLEERGQLGHQTWIRVEKLEKGLCGKSRPIFFRGVATVVAKLFNVVEPDVAVFGKKDYQQWRIICRMVQDLDFSVEVIGSEIVRDADGLAMSSRNVYLSAYGRQKALSINRCLSKAKSSIQSGEISCKQLRDSVMQEICEAGGRIDYAEIILGKAPLSCPPNPVSSK